MIILFGAIFRKAHTVILYPLYDVPDPAVFYCMLCCNICSYPALWDRDGE